MFGLAASAIPGATSPAQRSAGRISVAIRRPIAMRKRPSSLRIARRGQQPVPAWLRWLDGVLRGEQRVLADRRSAYGRRRAHRLGFRGQPLPDAPGRDRDRQDGGDGVDDREAPASGARDRAQQDAGRAALQRVPGVLPTERGRVLRLLLRLLPARGVRPAGRPLHREGLVGERRHRPPAPRGDERAPDAPRRRHRRVGLVHLRDRLARGLRGEDGAARARAGGRPRRAPAQARGHPVLAQRLVSRPRPLPRARRRDRGAAGVDGVGLPHLALRGRGRADHALRPGLGRDLLEARAPDDLPGDAVRDRQGHDRALDRRDQARAPGAGEAVRRRGQAARVPPDPAAHRVRHGDAARARLLQRDRELLADPRQPPGRLAAEHAARLLPGRLRRLRGRVAPDGPADRRHVRGRPLAQADARRLRLPASLGARQPAAALRRVPRAHADDSSSSPRRRGRSRRATPR